MEFTPVDRVDLPCGPLAFRRGGSGAPLLLIHGWRGSSSHWQTTLDALGDMRSIHAVDLPGHGETPPRANHLTTEGLARLLLDYADHAGLERFDVVGHSYGAAVAVALAAQRPERVRRVVLTCMGTARTDLERQALAHTHAGLTLTMPWWRPWFAMMRPWPGVWQPWIDWFGAQPDVSRAIAGAFLSQVPDDHEVVGTGVREFLYTDPLSAMEVAVDATSPHFQLALGKVRAPVLLVAGDRDPIMPVEGVTALARYLQDCQTVLLGNCGHIPMIEWPDQFHRELRGFLGQEAD